MVNKAITVSESFGKLTLADLSAEIKKSSHYRDMQAIYFPSPSPWKSEYDRMGISGAVVGGAQEAALQQTYTPAITITIDEYTKLKADLAEAQKSLAERDEIIEALAADLEDIDALKEEIVALRRIAGAPKPEPEFKHTEVSIPLPGTPWIEWHGGPSPIPMGRDFQVKFDTHNENYIYCNSGAITWEHDGHCIPITAYRLVP